MILAIDAALGRDVFDRGISGVYSDLFVAFFIASLLALVAGAFVAIRGVFLPQVTLAFRRRDVEGLADGDLVLADSVEIKRTLIRTYGDELVSEEARNDRKLDVVNRAALLLMLGVLSLACSGATLAIEHLTMGESSKQPTKSSAPIAQSGGGGVQARPQPPAKLSLGLVKKSGAEPQVERRSK